MGDDFERRGPLLERMKTAVHLFQSGRLPDADAVCHALLSENPALVEALSLRAIIAFHSHNIDSAVRYFEQALDVDPGNAGLCTDFGKLLSLAGRQHDALVYARRATELAPEQAPLWLNLGVILSILQRRDDAIAAIRCAIALDPHCAESQFNLAVLLSDGGTREEVVDHYRQAVALNPLHAKAWNNLGAALRAGGQYEESLRCYINALQAEPRFANALSGMGLVHQEQGRITQSLECFARALEIDPGNAGARFNSAVSHLKAGNLTKGWENFDARWEMDQLSNYRRRYPQPEWDGTAGAGRTLLVYAEQGYGDTFQFIRYMPLLTALGFNTVLHCAPELRRVLSTADSATQVVTAAQALPRFDVHAAMLSLPRLFATDLKSIPTAIPYLHAEPQVSEDWRRRLSEYRGHKIGICWRGNPAHQNDRYRSFDVKCFADIARIPGIQLFSLQKPTDASKPERWTGMAAVEDLGTQLDPNTDQFIDTAGVLENLDLLITADTSVAHLAGALGRPVWVLLPYASDWRWMLERDDSPWYPTMRLFRQRTFDNWEEVFQRVHEALQEHFTIGGTG